MQPRRKALHTGNGWRCREGGHLLGGAAAGASCPGMNCYPKAAASAAGTQLTCSFQQLCRCVAPHRQSVPTLDRGLSVTAGHPSRSHCSRTPRHTPSPLPANVRPLQVSEETPPQHCPPTRFLLKCPEKLFCVRSQGWLSFTTGFSVFLRTCVPALV